MPWIQSASKSDVEEQSGVQGWESAMNFSQPDHVRTNTSGGASVSFAAGGAVASAGATAGDIARIDGMNALNYSGLKMFRVAIAYSVADVTPFTDDAELGWFGSGLESLGAWLDLTDGQYKTLSSNTAAATLPASGETSVLTIEIDITNNETRFEQSGAVDETATIADAQKPQAFGLLRMASNGGGESVEIPYARQTIHGETL